MGNSLFQVQILDLQNSLSVKILSRFIHEIGLHFTADDIRYTEGDILFGSNSLTYNKTSRTVYPDADLLTVLMVKTFYN